MCTLDLNSGHLAFSTANTDREGSPEATASHKLTLTVKKHCKLFPTVITTPSTERVIDFDFTPDLCCNSISYTLTPPSSGAKLSPCPSRFKVMALQPSRWIRQPFRKVPYTAVTTAKGSVKIHSYKEPSYLIYATLPEEDQVMNLLEISEQEELRKFHIYTLEAYRAVASNCNRRFAKKIGEILDAEQLLHCLKLRGMHYSLCATYIDLFNTLHFEPEVQNTLVTHGEFIIPLCTCSKPSPLFYSAPKPPTPSGIRWSTGETDKTLVNQATVGHSIRSTLSCRRGKFDFSARELKEMVFYNLEKLLVTK